ncbi:MAG: putative dehydrogenase [Chloroflexi bacterium AL-W]|nr:putative dehydrogenase [Chloroflexi bacterium AL-N1]NOK67448.1 putative dehydrogenase [Chloroflexi bacterium AL-N10]NOK75060.1 putative dehydrogenase [Chloroflexi bacterium AL-N5]NOK81847.1 putative dehydrogenase [Chloroflexi bacterium AL-W]NOK89693.1 putative dehydrogenase [Chloroflexi bacterium AL-N15]
MTPVRIIQVGMGGWGQDWLKNVLANFVDAQIVAHVDTSTVVLQQIQQRFKKSKEICFETLETACAAVDAEAVLITAALPAHVPVALAALQAGKHVLVEKPFTPTLAEAQQLVEMAQNNNRTLMVSQNYRFFPAVQAVTTLLKEKQLGTIGTVNVNFRFNMGTVLADGHHYYTSFYPLLADMAIHHFDLMRLTLGQDATQVSCVTWNPSWSKFIDPACAAATITFADGTCVNYRGSWVSTGAPTQWGGEWSVECADGEISWSSRASSEDVSGDWVKIHRTGATPQNLPLTKMFHTDRVGSLAAFIAAICTGQQPTCSGYDNLGSIALMHTVIEASKTGMTLQVPKVH